jgi:cytochrome b561
MTVHRHSVAVIAIHWLSVVLLVLALATGVALDELPRGDWRNTAQLGHFSFGVLLLTFTVLRVPARLFERSAHRRPAHLSWAYRAAQLVGWAMIVLMLLVPTVGLLDWWAHGRAVPLAGGWVWPVPFEVPGRELWGEAHETLAWMLVWLVCVHIAAAAWHGWVLHDTTLKRIWFGR